MSEINSFSDYASKYNTNMDYSSLFGGGAPYIDNGMGGINVSDYAMIKNGSYGKLMKAYYAKQDADKLSQFGDSSKTLTLMRSSADSLKKSAEVLGDVSLYEKKTKLASAGKMNADGNMDYGVKKGNYLGHGSNLVYTTDGLDMMRSMDSGAYDEYQRISRESSNSDRQLNTLKYLTNWYSNAVTKNPHMVEKYEAKSDEYIEKNVKNQKVDSIFSDLKTESKSAFIESLKAFQAQNPNFLSNIVNKELSRKYWAYGIIA